MTPTRLAAIICTCVAILGCSARIRSATWDDSDPSALSFGPYVLLAGPDKAFVAFSSKNVREARVDWVADDNTKGTVRANRDDDRWVARLDGLPRGPLITYSVIANGARVDGGTFRTGTRADEDTFRFVAFGDTRTGHAVHQAVVKAIANERIDFVIHTGDMVEFGGKEDEWKTFFRIERPLLRKVPILPAIGNHDISGRRYYERYFLIDKWAGGARYFVTDWGNLRVVAIDVGIECTQGCSQYSFVRKALADGARDGKLMVIALHYPPYSSGAHGSDKRVQEPVTELAKRYGVELVVAGHDHNYERTQPIEGTTYVVTGSAGAPIRAVNPQWFTSHARTEPHYVLIDVERNRLTVRAVNLRGETFDSAIIVDNPPKP